jgi:hypothetical protein
MRRAVRETELEGHDLQRGGPAPSGAGKDGCSDPVLWGVRAYACAAWQDRQQATAPPDTNRRATVADLELQLLDLDTKVCWTGVGIEKADPTGYVMIGRIGTKDSDGQTRIFARIATSSRLR